jgi:hypothetical protein
VHHPTEEYVPPEDPSSELALPVESDEPLSDEYEPVSDELEPVSDEVEAAAPAEPATDAGGEPPPLYDFETDEGSLDFESSGPPSGAPLRAPAADQDEEDEFSGLGPREEAPPPAPADDDDFDDEPYTAEEEQPAPSGSVAPATGEEQAVEEAEDLLAESPDFIEEESEEEDLWFEKGPPQDFDFDDKQK